MHRSGAPWEESYPRQDRILVIVGQDILVRRALLREVFRTVLGKAHAVSIADRVEGDAVLGGGDGEIGGVQAEQLAHRRAFYRQAAELYRDDAARV